MNHKMKMLIPALMAMTCGAALAHGPGESKFKMMDTNGDGQISSAEHAAGVTKMFSEMDADKDGFVTAAEMDTRHEAMMKTSGDKGMKGPGMSSADKIAKMDTDGDGKLSAAEHDAGAASMFTKMDADGNGMLSHAEVEKAEGDMMKADKGHMDHMGHDMKPEAKPTGTN